MTGDDAAGLLLHGHGTAEARRSAATGAFGFKAMMGGLRHMFSDLL